MAVLVLASGCTGPGGLRTESHSVDVGDASSVHALVRMGAGDLEISGGAKQLLDSTFTYNADALGPEIEYEVTGESGRLVVRQRDGPGNITLGEFRNEWKLRFNNDVPLLLSLEFGAGDGNLELGSLNLSVLDLRIGAGDVRVNLAGSRALSTLSVEMGAGDAVVDLRGDWQQDLEASIKGGVGSLTLLLPENTGVRVGVEKGIGEIDVTGLKKEGESYVNDAFGNSGVTLNIDVETGIGEIFLVVGNEDRQVDDQREGLQAAVSNDADLSELEAAVLEEMNETHTPGTAVAVVSGDEIVFARGFGVSNIETGAPVTPDTLFRIGSTTKMYTAATLVTLAEDRKLDLNEPVGSYVKGLIPGLSQVTAHQLLTHTAGLRDEASSYGRHDEAALSEEVRVFDDSLFFTGPGEIFSYSNPGYALAGLVAEEAGDKPYADQVKESLFLPLGMNRTTFRPTEAMAYPLAQGHYLLPDGSSAVIRPYTDNAANWPAGFMFSNVNELSRFAIAFMNEGRLEGKQVLSPSVISKLSTPYSPVISSYDNGSYGYGLFIHDYRGVQVVEHPGGMEGFTCQFLMVPEHRFAVIILSNTYGTKFPKSTEKAMELFLPLEAEMAAVPETNVSLPMTGEAVNEEEMTGETAAEEKAVGEVMNEEEMSEEEMTAYAGHYYNSPELYLDLVKKDGRLFLKIGELEAPVTKVGESRFLATNPFLGQPLEFILVPGENGNPEYLHMSHRALKKVREVQVGR